MEEKQPECNIGLTGHVDHGKTTLVAALVVYGLLAIARSFEEASL